MLYVLGKNKKSSWAWAQIIYCISLWPAITLSLIPSQLASLFIQDLLKSSSTKTSLCDPETLRIFAVMASTKVQRIMTQPIVRCLLHLPFLCFVQLFVLFHNVLCFFFRGVLVLQNLIFRFLQSVSPPFRFIWLVLSFGFLHNACI